MIKRTIWIIVIALIVVFVGGYLLNSYNEKKAKKDAAEAEVQRIGESTAAAVAQLVKRTNAVDYWEDNLSNHGGTLLRPILTIELEKLWLTDRPIVFLGTIKDIATKDKENYRVEIERSSFSGDPFPFTELQLSLECPKQRIDSLLKEHPALFDNYLQKKGIAVIAAIDEIETKTTVKPEDEWKEIKIGKGKCIDIVYAGDVQLTMLGNK
jgi:hypothetical protein